MAKWALLMFIITGAGVMYIAKTLAISRETLAQAKETTQAAWQTVEATQRIGERQTRAYVNVEGGAFKIRPVENWPDPNVDPDASEKRRL